ncbi:MAG: L-aspartate oxidase [Elusimicrobiota bacterium]|jgi:L-aspartate oxidase
MNDIEADYLIIGSGIAGLSAAIKLSELGTVALVSKKDFLDGATSYAQGGVAAVMSPDDSFELHAHDTIVAGAGLCKEDIVRGVVEEAPARIKELIQWGMSFAREDEEGPMFLQAEEQSFELGLEGGHSKRRVLHTGDFTGAEIARTLLQKAHLCEKVRFFEYHIAVDLITTEKLGGKPPYTCLGVYVLDRRAQRVITFRARRATLLASGGAGKVYLYTSNPDVATGDGMAMAYRAGANLSNMEFVQFHPTCLYHPSAKFFLISEAVRGEGGILRHGDGSTFMEAYHPAKELGPRDIVARAIDSELKKSGASCVYLDIRHKGEEFVKKRFPTIYQQCLRLGIDIAKDMIPVVPAAHFFCGGVQTDSIGRTTIQNLWAIGEVACTGLHGANRLASNSLLEGLVFAHRAYASLQKDQPVPNPFVKIPEWNPGNARNNDEQVIISHNWNEIRQLMWNYVGIVRSDKRLERAFRRIQVLQQEIHGYYWDFLVTPDLLELRNIATVAELVIRSAMMRQESRGLHYNLDHPDQDESLNSQDSVLQRPSASTAVPTLHFI